MIKISNIWTAYRSSLIGLTVTVTTIIYQELQNGPINWHTVGVAFLGSLLLAITKSLKEEVKP